MSKLRMVWGEPARGQGQEAGGIIATEHHNFQVIPSPGHSRDHQCLYEKNRGWLFSGDVYLGERSVYLHAEEEIEDLMETLQRLSTLDFGTIFCGHRGLVPKGPEAFRRKLAYLQSLQEDARHLARQGWTEKAIMTRLLGKEDMMCHLSRGEFSKSHLIRSLLKIRAKQRNKLEEIRGTPYLIIFWGIRGTPYSIIKNN